MKRAVVLMMIIVFGLFGFAGCKPIVTDAEIPVSGETSDDEETDKEVRNKESMKAPEEVAITDEDNVRYFSTHTDRIKYYTSSDELYKAAEVIIAGKCLEAKAVYKLNKLFTLSKVEVTVVLKGNISVGDIISVVEDGGRTSFGEYDKNCNVDEKAFETNGTRLPEDYKVVIGMDGFYPLTAGEEVLLFLGDTTGFLPEVSGTLYDVIGATDGKLYKQEDGVYRKASPSDTDDYVFTKENLTVSIDELQKIANGK